MCLRRLQNKGAWNLTGERKADVQWYKMKREYRPYGDTDTKRRLHTQTYPRRLQRTVNISENGKVFWVSIDNSKEHDR